MIGQPHSKGVLTIYEERKRSGLSDDGSLMITEYLDEMGHVHRRGLPARIVHRLDNGSLLSVEYLVHGVCHNEDGPAYIEFGPSGFIRVQRWYRYGSLHRVHGPAETEYARDGAVVSEKWALRGRAVVKTGEIARRVMLGQYDFGVVQ